MSKKEEFRVTIKARAVRTMTSEEIADVADRINEHVDAENKRLEAAWDQHSASVAKTDHELAELFKQVAEREEVVAGKEGTLAGTREALPEDLVAWKKGLERREKELDEKNHEWGCRYIRAELFEWEDRLRQYREKLDAREAELTRDRSALERTRAQLLSGGARDS